MVIMLQPFTVSSVICVTNGRFRKWFILFPWGIWGHRAFHNFCWMVVFVLLPLTHDERLTTATQKVNSAAKKKQPVKQRGKC